MIREIDALAPGYRKAAKDLEALLPTLRDDADLLDVVKLAEATLAAARKEQVRLVMYVDDVTHGVLITPLAWVQWNAAADAELLPDDPRVPVISKSSRRWKCDGRAHPLNLLDLPEKYTLGRVA
jgi:hypothetical protein